MLDNGAVIFRLDHDTLDIVLGGVCFDDEEGIYRSVPRDRAHIDTDIRDQIIKALNIH